MGNGEKKIQNHRHYLPQEIVEKILLRLPVKSLIRFRSVCKQWNTTIADDSKFADAHLRQSRKTPCTRLLEDVELAGGPDTRVAKLIDVSDDGQIREISAVHYPPPELFKTPLEVRTLCHCDGLRLIKGALPNDFVLWNPSNRRYKRLSYPYPFEELINIYGICQDPTAVNNYKVVIGDENGYAVYNCATNCWSEMREAEGNALYGKYIHSSSGASWEGCIYSIGGCNSCDYHSLADIVCEILCFNATDEKLKSVCELSNVTCLALLPSHKALYHFLFNYKKEEDSRVRVVKWEVGGGIKAASAKLPDICNSSFPRCLVHHQDQDKILLEVSPSRVSLTGTAFLLYDHTTERVQYTVNRRSRFRGCVTPYMENLFLLN